MHVVKTPVPFRSGYKSISKWLYYVTSPWPGD